MSKKDIRVIAKKLQELIRTDKVYCTSEKNIGTIKDIMVLVECFIKADFTEVKETKLYDNSSTYVRYVALLRLYFEKIQVI